MPTDNPLAAMRPDTLGIGPMDGAAAVRCGDGRVIQIGWPVFGPPMFYPTHARAIKDGRLQIVHDMGALGQIEDSVDLTFQWTLKPGQTAIQPYIMYGQSLAMNLGHDQSITDAPIAAGRALRYDNAGAGAQMSVSERPGFDTSDFGPCHFPNSDLDRLVDLHEDRGESPVSASVAGFLPALADDTAVIATNHARGGMAISKLLPKSLAGTRGSGIQYAGLLRSTIRTRQFCDFHDCQMRQPIVSFIQGENFPAEDWQLYTQKLAALQAALTQDLGKITGSNDQVLVFTDQTAVMINDPRRLRPQDIPAALAQLRLSQHHPDKFICVAPKYFLPRRSTPKGRGDPLHLLASASHLLGAYHGRAIAQTLRGAPWQPLQMATYDRQGAVIQLTVTGGDGSALAIDTQLVAQTRASVFGFDWVQEGGKTAKITQVTLQNRTITITLDDDPGKAGQDFTRAALTIGLTCDDPVIDTGPLTGGRTNIRDTCPDVSALGAPMFNWLCHDWIWETKEGLGR